MKLLEFEFGTIMEFIVLGAIGIELFALYNHSKIDNRMDEHILDTELKLEKYDVLVQVLNSNISKLDEHLILMRGYINNLDEHMNNLDEHMRRYDKRLDEHVTRLDDLLWKFYTQRPENINDNQNPKINKESRSKS